MMRVGGASLDAVANSFGVSRDSVHRHFTSGHVSDKRRAELMCGPIEIDQLVTAATSESRSLLEQLSLVRSVLLRQFISAAEANDRPQVANVGGRLLESLRELGRVTGELRELAGVTVNQMNFTVVGSPQFTRLQEGLLQIARAHPDARAKIVDLLESLEDRPAVGRINGGPAMIEAQPAAHE